VYYVYKNAERVVSFNKGMLMVFSFEYTRFKGTHTACFAGVE
jgi:hypothetical protein